MQATWSYIEGPSVLNLPLNVRLHDRDDWVRTGQQIGPDLFREIVKSKQDHKRLWHRFDLTVSLCTKVIRSGKYQGKLTLFPERWSQGWGGVIM